MYTVIAMTVGVPLAAAVLAVVLRGVQPHPVAWALSNTAFTVLAAAVGAFTWYFAVFANGFWGLRHPHMVWEALTMFIGPALSLAGITLAWAGLAKSRFGLTLTGAPVAAVAPLAVLVALQLAEVPR